MRNVLLITADDMNYDSIGCMGCAVSNITPRIDQLAREGMMFSNSYVAVPVCQPSRSVLLTGRYPHRNGARGFERIDDDVTTLTERLREYGYYNGIIGKVDHLEPRYKFAWDHIVKTLNPEENWGRDPEKMYSHTVAFIQEAKEQCRPFFLMANTHDPHRPFAGSEFEIPEHLCRSGKYLPKAESDGIYYRGKYVSCDHYYEAEDITVPGFLPDLEKIRREVADYYSSVHRADAAVGRILDALSDEGMAENTLVLFLSDNGAAFPFAKTNCYQNGTRTPFFFRLPGVIPQNVRNEAIVSSIDVVPTVLDLLDLPAIDGVDGCSMKDLLVGMKTEHYDDVFTFFFKTARNAITGMERHYPMRCVQNKKYSYIFNAWADGETEFRNESMSGLTFDAMCDAGVSNPEIQKRVEFMLYRTPEEFYDLEADPNCLKNLTENEAYFPLIQTFRERMYGYMVSTGDELAACFFRRVLEK